ncbi:MAG: hypothetical protein LBH98_09340 [Chitinispirillales bacterium]|jgi:DNA-binding NtrC family response regulator|nr:hypothetical protein [Chitinispirillales bacterium]
MLQKVKDRQKVLILSKEKEIENDICIILSSHGYSIDITENEIEAEEKIIYYKPSIFIADINLLPEYPEKILSVFNKARKIPTFLIIEDGKLKEKQNRFLEYSDEILQFPFNEDNLYHKIKKAVNYNRIVHDNEYYEGIFLVIKLFFPLLVLFLFVITLQ